MEGARLSLIVYSPFFFILQKEYLLNRNIVSWWVEKKNIISKSLSSHYLPTR